jgi:Gpi18-like mannosyltransferase
MNAFWNFWQPFTFWKFILALLLVGIILEVAKVLLGISIFALAAFGIYRLVRHIATRNERRLAATQAAIARLEVENARLEKLLHP